MKEFNLTEGDGELIIHLNGDNSKYEVTYDHGQIIFQNVGRKYIIPEGLGHYATFLQPDPNTGKKKYLLNNVRDLYRDTTPTDFGLGSDLVDLAVGSTHFTEEIVIGGINESTPVVAPAGVKIWVNGVEVSSGTTVEEGDVVKFELTAGSELNQTTSLNLSVGDITKTINLTTITSVKNCKEILDYGLSIGDGIYTIKPAETEIQTYCDMTTDGGGWTLLLGAGLKYGKTDAFWNGTAGTNTNQYFRGNILNSSMTEELFKSLPFTEMVYAYGDGNNAKFTSTATSTFVEKKNAVTPFSGGDGYLTEMVWNKSDRDAYTYADFLLGGRTTQAAAYGDYNYLGIGINAWASSLTTSHYWTNNPGTTSETGFVTGTYYHSIANVHHRSVGAPDTYGILVR